MTRSMNGLRATQPLFFALALSALPLAACATTPVMQSVMVTATAYNSTKSQTNHDPTTAAWGDRLEPGMKAIAVSDDLLDVGLTRGTRVRIDGLPGEYVVLDRMPSQWNNRIDIYMGDDTSAARRWGKREVRIHWAPLDD
jgi:3D (Asp-Asp-Asp) domain-containing protein